MCGTLTCGRAPRGALKCLFGYTDDGFGVLDSRKISVHELQRLLNGWKASIKVPSVETCSPLPFLYLALEICVLDERKRKFGVKFSTFGKKFNYLQLLCLEIRTITRA